MRKFLLSAASALVAVFAASDALAFQAAPADTYLTPLGMSNPSQASQPFQLNTRDQNGNRIIINGRPVSSGGSTLSAPGSFGFGTMRRASQSSTLGQSTLSAVSIGNSISINNVRNSTIVITQTNTGDVSAQVGANAVANDNAPPPPQPAAPGGSN